MQRKIKLGVAFLAAMVFAIPLAAGAADTKDKPAGTMDKATDKVKDTTNEAKEAVGDSWLTSKTKIALCADDRVKGKDVRVETVNGEVFLRGKIDSQEAKAASEQIAKSVEGVKKGEKEL